MIRLHFALTCLIYSTIHGGQLRTPPVAGAVHQLDVIRCLEAAKVAAAQAEFAIDRAESWEVIAEVQLQSGDRTGMQHSFSQARMAIGVHGDFWYRPWAYESLAWQQWRSGEKAEARLTLIRAARETKGIGYVVERFACVYRLAMDQTQMNDPAAAEITWDVARKMKREESELTSYHFVGYAAALAKARKIDEARAVAEEIKDDVQSSDAWEAIAEAYIELGDLKSAEAIVPKMRFSVDAQHVTERIIEAKAKAGDLQAIKTLAASRTHNLSAAEARLAIVQEKLKAGDVDGAIAATNAVEDADDRVEALCAIVLQLVKRGDMIRARKLASQAAKEADQVEYPECVEDVFCGAAKAELLAGDRSAAVALLDLLRQRTEKLNEQDWRDEGPRKWRSMAMIATTQAEMADFQSAETTLADMQRSDNNRERALAARSIARRLARSSGFAEAAHWAQTVMPDMVRCYAWVGAAEGISDRK